MSTISGFCDQCGGKILMYVSQSILPRKLKLAWHLSYLCPHCGSQVESDDIGIPPENIRNAILLAEGQWKIIVQETTKHKKLIATQTLRATLRLSLKDAVKLKAKIPGVVMTGTKTEVHRLQQALSCNDVKVWIEPAAK